MIIARFIVLRITSITGGGHKPLVRTTYIVVLVPAQGQKGQWDTSQTWLITIIQCIWTARLANDKQQLTAGAWIWLLHSQRKGYHSKGLCAPVCVYAYVYAYIYVQAVDVHVSVWLGWQVYSSLCTLHVTTNPHWPNKLWIKCCCSWNNCKPTYIEEVM